MDVTTLSLSFLILVAGCVVYLTYGINHSNECRHADHVPVEHRGLIYAAETSTEQPVQETSASTTKVVPVTSDVQPVVAYHSEGEDSDTLLIP